MQKTPKLVDMNAMKVYLKQLRFCWDPDVWGN